MPQKWKGDSDYQLPAHQVEPYRLWFEFLKLALTDASLKVDLKRYKPWGDISQADFREWWDAHWRALFAVDIGVEVIDPQSVKLKPSDKELFLRVPLYQGSKRTLSQVKEILERHGASERLKDMAEGQYRLQVGNGKDKSIHPSTRFLKNLSKVRLLLNIYRFWLSNSEADDRRRLELTALSYFKWADAWNRKIKEKKWNRPVIDIPTAIRAYVEYLQKLDQSGRRRLSTIDDSSDNRRQIARYIRKARQIALNVAQGRFPGDYE